MRKLFNTKVKIEEKKTKLSDDNLWISEYELWHELWSSIFIKDISSRRALYFFIVKWKRDFPRNFRVRIEDKIFTPTQVPIFNPSDDTTLFHAIRDLQGVESPCY
jgi:hypothetical protein